MTITLEQPAPSALAEVVDAVASWQQDGVPVQVHPGDLGWHARFGAEALAGVLRVWRRDGRLVAAGIAEDGLVRLALSPEVDEDEAFAERLVDDLTGPARAVLPAGRASVEARYGAALRTLLVARGWAPDEAWTPLLRELSAPVEDCGLRLETVDAEHVRDDVVRDRVAVQRAAFAGSTFTVERWHAMAGSPGYRRGRCLVGYDREGHPVAAATVWSAGPGRPGLIEPLGAHPDHRGRGHGRAITLAAAAELRSMGASSVGVCTPASNIGAVAAYASAGFRRLRDVTDFLRPA